MYVVIIQKKFMSVYFACIKYMRVTSAGCTCVTLAVIICVCWVTLTPKIEKEKGRCLKV